MPAQLIFGTLDVNARGPGLPLVALLSLAVQASIVGPQQASLLWKRFDCHLAASNVGPKKTWQPGLDNK